jgi:hypothetical protein
MDFVIIQIDEMDTTTYAAMEMFGESQTFVYDEEYDNWTHPLNGKAFTLFLMPAVRRNYSGPEMLQLAIASQQARAVQLATHELQSYFMEGKSSRVIEAGLFPSPSEDGQYLLRHVASFLPRNLAILLSQSYGFQGSELDSYNRPAASLHTIEDLATKNCYERYMRFMNLRPKCDARHLVFAFGEAFTKTVCALFKVKTILACIQARLPVVGEVRDPDTQLAFLPLEMWQTIMVNIARKNCHYLSLDLSYSKAHMSYICRIENYLSEII